MKKTELVEGVEYAIGGDYDRNHGRLHRGLVSEVNGERELATYAGKASGMRKRGIVVRFAEEAQRYTYAGLPRANRIAGGDDRDILFTAATPFHMPWEDWLPVRAERAAQKEAGAAERERVKAVLAEGVDRLRSLGVEAERWGRPVSVNPEAGTVTLHADALLEFMDRTDPVRIAGETIAAVAAKHSRDEDEWHENVDVVIERLKRQLAMTKAEREAPYVVPDGAPF